MKRLYLSLLFTGFTAWGAFAQTPENCNNNFDDDGDGLVDCLDPDCAGTKVCEVCDDGIDNDNDGFIDCFDKECSKSKACDDSFIGNDNVCSNKPTTFPKFSIKKAYETAANTASHLSRVVVGDIDRDGVPDVISSDRIDQSINISKVVGGVMTTKKGYTNVGGNYGNFSPGWEDIAIANLDNDNCGEIFIVDGSAVHIYAYDCNFNQIWAAPISLPANGGTMGLADFNGDGKVELYVRNRIYNASTGVLIGQGAEAFDATNGGPVAVDINGDSRLELVCGLNIYDVDITAAAAADRVKLNVAISSNRYSIRNLENSTSVADFDQDGFLDVLAVGSLDGTTKTTQNTTIMFWNLHKSHTATIDTELISYSDFIPSDANYVRGWKNGTGRINIADIDGNGKLNASYVSGKYLYTLEHDMTKRWRKDVVEETSGYTGCTMFDFNGDGSSEIVYRDEDFIYIIRDSLKVPVTSPPVKCLSRTNQEYPVVADIDGDNQTEICVTCLYDDAAYIHGNIQSPDGTKLPGHIRVYKSGDPINSPWVPARRVWNQHGYFNVNVNNDLSIPKVQQKHHLVFSLGGNCTIGANRPLNSFLNQSPYLDSQGCPKYTSPDIVFSDEELKVTPPTCPDKSFKISFGIKNIGDATINGNIPVTFYKGNPLKTSTAQKLNTVNAIVNNFGENDSISFNPTVIGTGETFWLYIVLNDAGTSTAPIKLPNNTNLLECNYDNMDSVLVTPLSVPVIAEKKDFFKCIDPLNPTGGINTGVVNAYVLIGGVKNTTDFNFYWTKGGTLATVKPIPADFTGSTVNGLAEDDYWVYAVHKTASCNSDTAVTKPLAMNQTVTVTINLIDEVTNCLNPNGKMDAVVNNDPALNSQYDFVWFESSQIGTGNILSTTHSASGLRATSYFVEAKNKTSGCTGNATAVMTQNTPKPPIVATIDDLSCSATGTPAKATATINGQTTGYTFNWFNGSHTKPGTPDNTNSVYNNLPVGAPNTFTVFAVHTASQCSSDTVVVTLKKSTPPTIAAVKVSDQISCDPSNVLGAARVDITGYDPAKFSIQWYKGPNTVTAISGATGLTITNKAVGTYTVKVTDLQTTCSDADMVTIDLNTPMPVVAALNIISNSACIPSNGGFEASVTPGPVTDYTFFLNDGTTTVSQASNIFTGLDPKNYLLHAVNNITKCLTDDVPVNIIDNRPTLTLDSVTFIVPTDCTSPNGAMTVEAKSSATTTGFVFRWYRGGAAIGAPVRTETVTTAPYLSTLSNIQSGSYTAEVEDLSTGCRHAKEFFLGFANNHFLKYVSDTPITNCVPAEGGSVKVHLIATTTLPGYDQDSYDLYAYEGTSDPHAGSIDPLIDAGGYVESMITHPDADPSAPRSTADYTTTYPSLKANTTYTFVAVSKFGPTIGCRVSVSRKMRIQTANPAVTADPMAVTSNKNCNLTTTNGSGSIHVTLGSPATDYSFAWTDVTAGTVVATAGVNGEDAVNLKPGTYKVRATYTTALNQGCFVEKTYNVTNNEQQIMVAAGGLTIDHLVNCDPATGNTPLNEGGAEFTQLTVDGAAVLAPFGGYAFNWFNANATPAAGTVAPPYKIIQLTSGEYYVTAVNATTTCDVTQSFTINDETINTVFVELLKFKRELRCVRPDVGFLEVQANGTSATNNYSFQWFNGPSVSDPLRPETGTTITGLEARQFFTVRVTNNDNGCRAVQTYDLDQQVNPIQIQAFASPLSECVNTALGTGNDSQLSSLVTNDAVQNQIHYRFDWFVDVGNDGSTANDVQIGATKTINNVGIEGNQLIVGASTYPNQQIYVVAVDLVDTKLNHETLCRSEQFKVNIEDVRMPPPVVVTEVMPMTNCVATDELANGMASANVNGDITNYTFDWFKGTPAPPVTPPGFYNGVEASGLQPYEHPSRPGVFIEYTVLATNVTSGCSNTAPLRINNMPMPGPDVQVIVSSLNLRCDGVNTGALQANVGGVTANYVFDWYDGDFHDEVNAPRPAPDNVGEFYRELANGFYSVMATSEITGCKSRLKAAEITPQTIIPDFDFSIIPALCEDSTGSATVSINGAPEIETIVWRDLSGSVVTTGPVLGGAMTGDYKVTVTTIYACQATKDVHIPSEIKPFNGISRNGDNKNSYFHINCIEEFESNIVKVFNRAGTLVYQAEGYDNNNILFDGISNKGISPMGTNLPDGTYFYIIDKRNGSKPVAGYLEIVN